jgi:nucleotide-binding universal stress UspA family protein
VIVKILLAIDGSVFSDAAIAGVIARPWPAASEVKVICVFEIPIPPTPEAWTIPPEYFQELDLNLRDGARRIVNAAVVKLSTKLGNSVAVSGMFVQGSPRNAILEEAERWGADLIVVGSHGYRAWERFLLGSVSQAVVAHAHCSVEVVRSRTSPPV